MVFHVDSCLLQLEPSTFAIPAGWKLAVFNARNFMLSRVPWVVRHRVNTGMRDFSTGRIEHVRAPLTSFQYGSVSRLLPPSRRKSRVGNCTPTRSTNPIDADSPECDVLTAALVLLMGRSAVPKLKISRIIAALNQSRRIFPPLKEPPL